MENSQTHRRPLNLASGWLYPIDKWAEVDGDGSSGSWRILLSTHSDQKWFSDQIQVYRGMAIVDNFHRHLRVICVTVPVSDRFLPEVEGALAEERMKIGDKYGDIQFEHGVYEGRPGFVATVSYENGFKTRDLANRLEHIFRGGLKQLDVVVKTRSQALKNVHDGLRDGTPTMLTRDDFMILLDPTLVDLEIKPNKEGVDHGYWDYAKGEEGEIWCEALNYGNQIDLTVWEPLYVNNPSALNEKIFAALQTRIKEKTLKGADNTIVEWYTDTTTVHPDDTAIRVRAQINRHGNKKGKELQETYKRFDTEYAYDLYELISEVRNEAWESYVADLSNKPLKALSRKDFLVLVSDGLDEAEIQKDGVTGGYWEFGYEDPLRNFEIYNYADRMELTMLVESPENLSDSKWENVMKKTREKYSKEKPTPEAKSVEILLYPEYEQYIWLKAVYPYDGNMTIGQLEQAYFAFTNDYSEKVAKDIHKWAK